MHGASIMQMNDLNSLSLEELKALEQKVGAAIRQAMAQRRKDALAAAEAAACQAGFTLNDLIGEKYTGKRHKASAKYRDPENPELTWSGRGRQPGWYKSAIQQGAAAEDLLI